MFGRRKTHQPNPTSLDPAHDSEGFADIYAAYAGRVHAYALQRLHDPDLAADITSIVFTRAIANLPSFQRRQAGPASDSAFEGWLMTIARNAIIDHVRANKRLTILDADAYRHHLDLTSPDPSAHPVPPDERDRLLDALHHLSATQRRIVLLRVQGWNGAEIADLLGMSHGAVRVAQHRAYARLRELLTEAQQPATSSSRTFTTEPDHV